MTSDSDCFSLTNPAAKCHKTQQNSNIQQKYLKENMCLTLFFLDDILQCLLQRDKQKTMSLHSQHYAVSHDTQLDQWHPVTTRFFPKIRLIMKSATHQSWMPWQPLSPWLCHHQIPPPIHFPNLPLAIKLLWPLFLHFHWTSRYAANYIFTTAHYHSKNS